VSALAQLGAWLLEPLPERTAAAPPVERPLVAVVGLAPGCGTTTVARALAARLAARDRVLDGTTDPDAVTVVVAPPDAEPALAELFARSLPARDGSLIVVNRGRRSERWAGRASLFIPESQLGARFAAAGWGSRGAFGRAISELATICGAAACA
jgi:hypothetical protein